MLALGSVPDRQTIEGMIVDIPYEKYIDPALATDKIRRAEHRNILEICAACIIFLTGIMYHVLRVLRT